VAAGVASGHTDEACAAAEGLRRIATLVATPAIAAHADAAEARVADGEHAVELWQDAVRGFHVAGLRFDEADSCRELAAIQRERGDDDGADEHTARALALSASLREGDGVAPGPLTDRQVEVIRLIARGLSNSEIAAMLQLSEHTVHRHIANIFHALDLSSRAAAAAYAVGHGLG